MAGRSGRAEEKGKVVLQTFDPENAVLRYAVAYDYQGFYENEISLRSAMAFPPFSKIVRILVSGEDDQKTLEVFKGVYEELQRVYTENQDKFIFFNKMRAPIKKIQDKHRYQVLMRLSDSSVLSKIYEICAEGRTREVLVSVEENPTNLT